MEIRVYVIIVAVAAGAAVAVRFARRFALKRALLDVPNERSSHRQPVPRLGGAAFMPIVLLATAFGRGGLGLPLVLQLAFFSGAVALFGISLLDDFRPLPTVVRFLVQFAAAGALVAAVVGCLADGTVESLGLGLPAVGPAKVGPPLLWSLGPLVPWSLGLLITSSLLTVGIVGLVNIHNFMDGIDGIEYSRGRSASVGREEAQETQKQSPARELFRRVIAPQVTRWSGGPTKMDENFLVLCAFLRLNRLARAEACLGRAHIPLAHPADAPQAHISF